MVYRSAGSGFSKSFRIGMEYCSTGAEPYLEHLFDLVTPIRLAELANPNRPL